MQFHGKLNEAEVKEATRFVRPKGYGARMTLSYLRIGIYAALVLGILIASLVQHVRIEPRVLAVRVAVLALIGGLSIYRYRKGSREAVAKLDASLPDTLTLSSDGVRLEGPNGAQGFQPWTSYTGYRQGAHVVVLQRKEKDLYNVLPVSALAEPEREALRGLLANSLPEGGR